MSSVAAHLGVTPSPLLPVTRTGDDGSRLASRRWPANALDELSLKFVIASRTARQPVLDFGCGDGLVTAAALARGAHVLAIDCEETSIQRLLARVPSQHHRRLRARVCRLQETDFKGNVFGAVHAARVLQAFDAQGVSQMLQKFFRWLYPGGQAFISIPMVTPQNESSAAGDQANAMPVHRLDEVELCRELVAAGFVLEETRCYALPWDGGQMCWSAIARCGL